MLSFKAISKQSKQKILQLMWKHKITLKSRKPCSFKLTTYLRKITIDYQVYLVTHVKNLLALLLEVHKRGYTQTGCDSPVNNDYFTACIIICVSYFCNNYCI